jgi:hypothetical protein
MYPGEMRRDLEAVMHGNDFNDFAKKHGARKEVWDEGLRLWYKSKSLREYRASVYGLPPQDFPVTGFTREANYLQWCLQVSGVMPDKRGQNFHQFMQRCLSEAEEEPIPPSTEEGIEVGVIILTVLKNNVGNSRDFDKPQPDDVGGDMLQPGEWLYTETVAESKCGKEVFIKYEGLRSKLMHLVAIGATETKITRKQATDWLQANGRYYDRESSPNRRRCAYVIPLELVEKFEVFAYRWA